MKILRVLLAAVITLGSLQAVARTPVPIVNYENEPVATTAGAPLTSEQVKQAIVRATTARQWVVADQGPGRMLATLHVRGKHTVTTEILYTPTKFSLVFSDSVNMNHSPAANTIHPFYNRWVLDLREAIRLSLVKG